MVSRDQIDDFEGDIAPPTIWFLKPPISSNGVVYRGQDSVQNTSSFYTAKFLKLPEASGQLLNFSPYKFAKYLKIYEPIIEQDCH